MRSDNAKHASRRSQSWYLIVCFAMVGFIMLLATFFTTRSDLRDFDNRRGTPCKRRLRSLATALYIYAQNDPYVFPDDLSRLHELGLFEFDEFSCTERKRSTSNYVYVPGLSPNSPTRRFLIFEMPGGQVSGSNVLFQDGHVEYLGSEALNRMLTEQNLSVE